MWNPLVWFCLAVVLVCAPLAVLSFWNDSFEAGCGYVYAFILLPAGLLAGVISVVLLFWSAG